jgi:hypothetical protein
VLYNVTSVVILNNGEGDIYAEKVSAETGVTLAVLVGPG